ncbi:MAG: hypothetical protein ACKO4Q_05080 [Planctomycetota bacterium]
MRKLLALFAVLAVLLLGWLLLAREGTEVSADPAAAPASASAEPDTSTPERGDTALVPAERSELVEPTRVETVRRDPRARVHGTIVQLDSNVRVPMANVEIVVYGGRGPEVRARTDAEGRFELRAEPGSRRIGAAPLNAPAWWDALDLPPEGDVTYDREVNASRKHCLRVWRREGEELMPVGGARVRVGSCDEVDAEQLASPFFARSHGLETRNDGTVQVMTGAEGKYALEVSADGLVTQVVALDLSPFLSRSFYDSLDGCMHVVLRNAGPPITGLVTAPDGTPLAGAAVFLDVHDSAGAGFVAREGGNWVPQALAASQPPMAWTDEQGGFLLAGPGPEVIDILSARIVVQPRRAGLVHHCVAEVDMSERDGATVFVSVPAARERTLRIVDREGKPVRGDVSVRDMDGLPHAPAGSAALWLGAQHTGRVFPSRDGRVKLVHAGGPARVGISPYDEGGRPRWDASEIEVVVPAAGDGEVRVQLP